MRGGPSFTSACLAVCERHATRAEHWATKESVVTYFCCSTGRTSLEHPTDQYQTLLWLWTQEQLDSDATVVASQLSASHVVNALLCLRRMSKDSLYRLTQYLENVISWNALSPRFDNDATVVASQLFCLSRCECDSERCRKRACRLRLTQVQVWKVQMHQQNISVMQLLWHPNYVL